MRWINKKVKEEAVFRALKKELSVKKEVPDFLVNILLQRGISDPDEAKGFLRPDVSTLSDPFLLSEMDIAVERINRALSGKEKILIYGDYDVDGTTSVALMTLFFQDIGFEFPHYTPDRYSEGYGLSYQGVDHAIENGITLIIALDCGTKAVDKINYANENGVDVIIVDHHTPGAEVPACIAMINPKKKDDKYPFKELPACGLALKLCQALKITAAKAENGDCNLAKMEVLEKYCDLVTLAIAADIVPMLDENRVIATMGLRKIKIDPLPGIAALQALSKEARSWDISDIVFFIGPRINAAGRLKNARDAVRLLIGQEKDLESFALDLHDYNSERKDLDTQTTLEARTIVENEPGFQSKRSTVVVNEKWVKGIVGIVAARLIENYYRPTIVLTRSGDYLVGSARSVEDFDLYAALEQCAGNLVQFGGHKYAAGLTLYPEKYEDFKASFEAVVSGNISDNQLEPPLYINYNMNIDEVDGAVMNAIKWLAPFGPGNEEPVFHAAGVDVVGGDILKDEHVRMAISANGKLYNGIAFGLAKKWDFRFPVKLDLVYRPVMKTWNGKSSLQLMIKDFKVSRE